jgi:LysR family positive regulator for ilvC
MDLQSLKLFLHLAGTLHFGKTAEACNISASALSRTVQRLEGELGRPLFVRDNRSVQLTPVGDRFRVYAQQTMDAWEQFRDSLREEGRVLSGMITLYSSVTAAYGIFPELFARFRAQYPGVHLRLQTGDSARALERVRSGAADVAVAARPDNLPRNLLFKTITVTPLLFVAPLLECETALLLRRRPVPWRQVPMILDQAALSRKRVEAWFRRQGIRPNVYAEVAGHEAILSMVRLGCGVGVVPELVLRESSLCDQVQVLAMQPELQPYHVGLCVQRRRIASPIVRAFWNIVPGEPVPAPVPHPEMPSPPKTE